MAKRTLVTADAVFAVADSLFAEGKTPSLRAVRQALGGGSFGSIGPFLQSWRRARVNGDDANGNGESDPLSPPVVAALDRLLEAARGVSDAVRVAGRDEDRAAEEAARWRDEVSHLQSLAETQIASLRAERDKLQADLAEARAELAELKAWRSRAVRHMKALSTKVGG